MKAAPPLRFALILLLSLSIVFLMHTATLHFLQKPPFGNLIIRSYVVNFALAAIIHYILYILREKYADQLGFLYIFGSLIKFIVFFIFFYPVFKSDGKMQTVEFASFFIPYVISLIYETLGVMKFLKK